MADLSALTPFTTSAQALSNLILVSPQKVIGYQPQNNTQNSSEVVTQPPALLFHYEGEQTVLLQSDITDHFIEDNTAIQDQVSLRPEIITTHGFIGELNNVTPKELSSLKFVADKLTVINAYTPVLSQTAIEAYNLAFYLYSVGVNSYNAAIASWSSLSNIKSEVDITGNETAEELRSLQQARVPNQNKQQIAFQQFYGYWRSRTLFTVQTPWAIFKNTIIQSLRAIQDADTKVITDFEVTFKVLRFAQTKKTASSSTLSSQGDPAYTDYQGRSANQASRVVDLGTSTPAASDSLASKLSSNFGLVA